MDSRINDLKGFKVLEMTEVYMIDNDGRKSSSIGFFKNQNTATVFAGAQGDSNWLKTAQALVLTDGTVGYVIKPDPVKLFDDEAEALKLKEKAIAKLSPAERSLLGLKV